MEKDTFEISSGGTSLIKGYGYGRNSVTITSVEGWDDVTMETSTVPKMIGEGSYILNEHVGENIVTAVFSVTSSLASARTIWKRLQNNCLTKGSSVTVTLGILDGNNYDTETATGRIQSVKTIPGASLSTITVEILCTNPRKTYS